MPSEPPVLLVHGLATSAERTWREPGWIDLLTDAGREVLAVDLLGHGDAPKPHDPAAYAELEHHLAAQLPEGPVDAIGFSLGARTVLALAVEDPTRFGRIVLAGVGRNLFERDEERGKAIAASLAGADDPDDREAAYFGRLADSPEVDREALVALLRRPETVVFTDEALARVTNEVLVVLGDQDFAGPADPLVDRLPNARLKTLRGVDHFATPNDFGFIDAALGFLGASPV